MAGQSLTSIYSLPPTARQPLLGFLTNSVITLTFGAQPAIERFLRLVYRAYTGMAMPYEAFIVSSTRRVDQHLSAPSDSIAFFAYSQLDVHPADIIYLTPGQSGWTTPAAPCCVVDIIAHNPSLVIPSRLFVPHAGTGRMEAFLQRTDMLPLFFTRMDGGVGVRIDSSADFNMLFDVPTRITAHSLKVILHLLNYPSMERQIQLRTATAEPHVYSRRLARLVAHKVFQFIRDAERENANIVHWMHPRWKMGSGAGYIGIGDIELLGVVFVSQGKVTPLLRVRSDFVFVV
ncbi:hypothetical protein PENSPDRAFT_688556 [Peniophora sp. CONT]|nr:hypothetical protein PENSPDRAFT_688556 [Peniophora sp. CONT]